MFDGDAFKNAYGFTKHIADLVDVIPEAIGKGTAVLHPIHGAAQDFSVSVTALDSRLESPYGNGGPVQPITFRVQVWMRDQLPQALRDCGWIVGADYPAQGVIKVVSVHWFWPGLSQHGDNNRGNECVIAGDSELAIDATGDEGIAKMTFTPTQDRHPDDDMLMEDQGIVCSST